MPDMTVQPTRTRVAHQRGPVLVVEAGGGAWREAEVIGTAESGAEEGEEEVSKECSLCFARMVTRQPILGQV